MFSEPNTLDNSYLFIDFAVLRELYITDIEEMMRNLDARLFPVRPPVRYEDHGVV
jgi:hypothetical protein